MNKRPLEGIRVVEMGAFVAVPMVARLMADWGADVIKLEAPNGDTYRTASGAFYGLPHSDEFNVIFQPMNINKRAIAVNLKNEEGKEALFKLLETTDIFITNVRPKPLEKLGIGYDALKEKFPRLICGYFAGFGEKGPDKDRAGYDVAAFWARGGALLDWAVAETAPSKPFPGFGDTACAMAMLSGLLAALYRREQSGRGDAINLSLFGTSLFFNNAAVIMGQPQFGIHYPRSRYEQADPLSPLYKTKDGDWLLISEMDWNGKHPKILKMIGKEEYADNPHFQTLEAVRQNMHEVVDVLTEGFAQTDTKSCMEALTEMDSVFEKISSPNDLYDDKQAWANGYLRELDFPSGDKLILPETPIQFDSVPVADWKIAPGFGEHTKEIFKEVGYTEEEIDALIEKKAILGPESNPVGRKK